MNDFGGAETDDILPFCTAGFPITPNTGSADLTHRYTPPENSTQSLYNLAPKAHHDTLAQVHRAESPRPEKGDWSENDWIQEHALYGYVMTRYNFLHFLLVIHFLIECLFFKSHFFFRLQ